MLLNCGTGEDSWESLRLQGEPTSQSSRKSVLNIHWKDWCCSWNFNTLATWCEELTHWKRPWFWERLKAEGEGDDRGWDGWMASRTQWTWVEQSLGVGDVQGSLACCSTWGRKESDMAELLKWTEQMCQCRVITLNQCTTLVGNVDTGEAMNVCSGIIYGIYLYLPLNFAVDLKLL